MPKKQSTLLVMRDYQPLSSRRYYKLIVKAVSRENKVGIRFEMSVLDDPQQAGRLITHDLPALLAPNSPLCKFLAQGFDIHLTASQSFDLASLVGRVVRIRFDKAREGCEQTIAAVKQFDERGGSSAPAASLVEGQEH